MELVTDQIAGYFKNLKIDDLIGYLSQCQDLQYCIINTLKKYELSEYSLLSTDKSNLIAFCAFNEDIQVRCEKEPLLPTNDNQGMWHLVFIGSASKFPDAYLQTDTIIDLSEYYEQANQKFLLWGERKPHQRAWYELRIPRALNYPLMDEGDSFPERVGLEVTTYSLGGRVEFYRYSGLSDWEEE